MSLPLPESTTIPEETAQLARTICPKGTLYMHIRDQLGIIYENQLFAPLFSTKGQPAEAPWRLALVCIFPVHLKTHGLLKARGRQRTDST